MLLGRNAISIMSGYPFGMLPKTTNLGFGSFSNEAFKDVTVSKSGGFNGMEKSRWLSGEFKGSGNSLDFGARIYDSRLGRWLSVDPLPGTYPMLKPFQFAGNALICTIDLDWLESEIFHYHYTITRVGRSLFFIVNKELKKQHKKNTKIIMVKKHGHLHLQRILKKCQNIKIQKLKRQLIKLMR